MDVHLTIHQNHQNVMYEIPQAKEEIIPQHDDIDFKDMKYERPDIDGIYAKIKDTIDKAKQSGQQDSVLSQYDQILKLYKTMTKCR